MRFSLRLAVTLAIALSACLCIPVKAQVAEAGTFLTIGAIRQGLNEALTGVQQATMTAGGEIRASGNSLQANIQNVIADIDAKFANRFDVVYTKLDGAERQFASDARELIYRSREAAVALVSQTGDQARRTIGEADIAAYNASYSLPCRSQIPRVVYWTPTTAIARGEEVVVEIHGNFLNFGKGAQVQIDGKPASKFSRNDRVITVSVPKEIVQAVTDKTSALILVSGLDSRTMTPRFASWLFGCGEELTPAPRSSVTVSLVPRVHYAITGQVWATYKQWTSPVVFQAGRVQRSDDNCDHQSEIGFQVCVPDAVNMRVVRGDIGIRSKSGASSMGPATLSGTTCVNFPAHLGGAGYSWVAGFRNCRGSAWLDADWQAVAERRVENETTRLPVNAGLPIGTYSYSINHAQSPMGEDWRWRYVVQISQMRGSQVLQSESLSDGRLDNGAGWQSAMKDGVLTVTLPSNAD